MSLIVVYQATLAKLLVMLDRTVLLNDLHLVVPVLLPQPVIVVQQISQAWFTAELQRSVQRAQRFMNPRAKVRLNRLLRSGDPIDIAKPELKGAGLVRGESRSREIGRA